MKYFYNKYKFSTSIFYKSIEYAKIEHNSGIFSITVLPFLNYCGKYHIHSVALKDSNRTLFLTMKSDTDVVDFDMMFGSNEFFISISHDGRKAMVFDTNKDGIILKG